MGDMVTGAMGMTGVIGMTACICLGVGELMLLLSALAGLLGIKMGTQRWQKKHQHKH